MQDISQFRWGKWFSERSSGVDSIRNEAYLKLAQWVVHGETPVIPSSPVEVQIRRRAIVNRIRFELMSPCPDAIVRVIPMLFQELFWFVQSIEVPEDVEAKREARCLFPPNRLPLLNSLVLAPPPEEEAWCENFDVSVFDSHSVRYHVMGYP